MAGSGLPFGPSKYDRKTARALLGKIQKYKIGNTDSFGDLNVQQQKSLFMELIKAYEFLSADVKYIMSFAYNKPPMTIYKVTLDRSNVTKFMKLSAVSSKRGGGYSLRFNPLTEEKQKLIDDFGAQPFIKDGIELTKSKFEQMVKDNKVNKFNRGDIMEKLIWESVKTEPWVKDASPFYEKGDINIDGIEHQIKYQRATFVSSKTIDYNLQRAFATNKFYK